MCKQIPLFVHEQACYQYMKIISHAENCSIVNISSISAHQAQPNRWATPGFFFFTFVFSIPSTVNKCSIKKNGDDWIRTLALWRRKQLLWYLCHDRFHGADLINIISRVKLSHAHLEHYDWLEKFQRPVRALQKSIT